MSRMSWRFVPASAMADVAGDWNGFVDSTGSPGFLRTEFIAPALNFFGKGRETVALGMSGGQLVAAAVLVPSGRAQWVTFQPAQLPLGAWVMRREMTWPDVLPSLISALSPLCLQLSVTQQDPSELQRPDESATLVSSDYVATGRVDIAGSFEAYWDARGKNLRQNLRKGRRKLEEQFGPVTFEFLEQPRAVESAFNEFADLESAGWKGGEGTAIARDNAQGRFYREVLGHFGKIGRSVAFRLAAGGKTLAVDFGLRDGDVITLLKTTYDEKMKSFSPAQLLHEDLFKAIFDRGDVARVEFFGKVMEWHTRWTDNERVLYHLTAYRWPIIRRAKEAIT